MRKFQVFQCSVLLLASTTVLALESRESSEPGTISHTHPVSFDESQRSAEPSVAVAKSREIESYRIYLGKVEVDPDKSSHLNPRYPGIVRSVFKNIGDPVSPGETLALIDSNIGVQTYPLKANIRGRIIHRMLAVGEFVDEQRLAFSIANLETMWVNITIRQGDLKHFRKGQEVTVASRDKRHHTTGRIFYISPVVDQHTMTAVATVEIANGEGIWKPGQYVDGYMVSSRNLASITVPKEAVSFVDGESTVFIQGKHDHFEARTVTLGKQDLHFVEVTKGLQKGEVVSTRHGSEKSD